MKSSGIIRKMDNLGRVVVPREIRKQFQIKDGDSIEFLVRDNELLLRKYSPLQDKKQELYYMCLLLEEKLRCRVYFYQGDGLIDVARNEEIELKVTTAFAGVAQSFYKTRFNDIQMYTTDTKTFDGFVRPVIIDGDFYGSFIIVKMELKPEEENQVKLICELITVQHQI